MKLKELRIKQGMTQKEIANILGISQQAYANYETGKRQPDQEMLLQIANFFDVSVDYLLGRVDKCTSHSLNEQLEGVDFALWSESRDMTEDEKKDIIDYIKFKKSQRNG